MVSALVVAGSDGAKILEAVDGAFNDIAPLVGLGIEAGRCAAAPSLAQSAGSGILAFRAYAADSALLDELARLAGAIGAIDAQRGWTFLGAPPAKSGD